MQQLKKVKDDRGSENKARRDAALLATAKAKKDFDASSRKFYQDLYIGDRDNQKSIKRSRRASFNKPIPKAA